jgi:hypothetical protein
MSQHGNYDPELPADFPDADPPLPPGWSWLHQDDMSPSLRACFRSRPGDEHRQTCPDCIENDAENTLRDAMWWRYEADEDPAPYPDGTYRSPEQAAQEIEAEAIELRLRAAKIREARS